MGNMKEQLFELQEQHAQDVFSGRHTDAEEEWNAEVEESRWFQEWLQDVAEQEAFERSLASIPARLRDARAELVALSDLIRTGQPGIVLRMALVHAVTVLDSFLMYSARALLIHPGKLEAYLQNATQLVRNKDDRKALLRPKWVEQEPGVDTPPNVYRWRAEALVAKVTFQTETVIRAHFDVLLDAPVDWPLALLAPVVTIRNDLVHRNGVTVRDEPVSVWPGLVEHAITSIGQIVEAAGTTLVQEEEAIVRQWTGSSVTGTDN